MKAPSEAQLRAMKPDQRATVRAHAMKLGGEIGDALVALIDSLGLPTSSGGMSLDDPIYCEMHAIVHSPEGKAAALESLKLGWPPLAGIDPLLQKKMGKRYSREAQGTMNAGSLVAEIMREAGYEKDGSGGLPPNCIARSGATWKPKGKLK